jgi:hypothetical protein
MRAVWSYWSVPYRDRRGFSWRQERTHALSWILSVELARRHFTTTALHTDDDGARFLIDQLGLPFDHVSNSLNALRDQDPDWWMLGKLRTYADQREPFVHIDSDAYLFKPLPERILSAPLLAQNPEPIGPGMIWYDVEACEVAIRSRGDGHIPPEWIWYRTFVPAQLQRAACCGIFGGYRLDFIHAYAHTVLGLLQNPANRDAFDHIPHKRDFNPFFEQYLLAACAARRKLEIAYLFESLDDWLHSAGVMGFTHLMADAKRDATVEARIESRVARDYPEAYERCCALFGEQKVYA